jgi:DNA-binding CsgD family transcriptional regulator
MVAGGAERFLIIGPVYAAAGMFLHAVETGIVGREAPLSEVDAFLRAASRGFAVLALEGEAGIGKTTVWREARRRAQESGARVLSCRPSAAEAKLSFAAVGDLLARVDDQEFAALPEPQREALDVALMRRKPSTARPPARAIAAGFLTLVQHLAAERELILAVDDWQWLDPPSRHVFEFAARRLEHERVGLLCSIRSPGAGSPVAGLAEEHVNRVALGPLSLAALGRIVAGRLGRSLPRPGLVRIAQASGGNPFYAIEIARLDVENDTPRPVGAGLVQVPDDLRALTAARIRRLPPPAREAVLLAAIMSGPDRRSVDVAALEAAEEAGIVAIDDAGRIEFTHPLFASAAYRSVSASRRRELHRLAAELVNEPEERARHLALASARPDPGVAAQLDDGAANAATRGAPDAAAELAELAAQMTPADDGEARARRLLAAGRLQFDAGDVTRAGELAEAVLAGSPTGGVHAGGLRLAAEVAARRNDFGEAARLATAALAVAGDDRALRAAIELDLVYCAVSAGDFAGAAPHARAAVADAEAVGDDGMVADALAVLTLAEFLGGRGLDRARLERALALEDPAMTRSFIMRPRFIQGLLQLWTGELDAAGETLEAMHAAMVERGQEAAAPMLSLYVVWADLWRGELDRASRFAAHSVEAAALVDDPAVAAVVLAASALAHAHDGRTALARREAGDALGRFERLQWRSGMIWPMWALGLAELSEDNPAGVDALLGGLVEQVARMGAGDPVLTMFLPDEVEALIALGQLDRAEGYLEPFERRAGELERDWAIAAAGRCRGALEGARGASAEAFAALERALEAHDRAGMPFERARTLLVAGEVHRRFKQRRKARELLEAAAAAFAGVGAPLWAAKARSALDRVGRPGTADGANLTETERRLAELAAAGLSNSEVAERAFVSVKTVESNLTRVYRKLGVRSRVGLANALRAAADEPPHA